jgi:hypothetical protein
MKPPSMISGTSALEFPNRCISAHIRAHSDRGVCRNTTKPLQAAIFAAHRPRTGLIAMQKVEGSNPFSRFLKASLGGAFVFSGLRDKATL